MKKRYSLYMLISIGMLISAIANAQLPDRDSSIKPVGNSKLLDHFSFNSSGMIVGSVEYAPIVRSNSVRVSALKKDTTIHLSAGELSGILNSFQKTTITDLQLTGTIDARDFKTMRDSMPVLSVVDVNNVSISAYTGMQGTGGTQNIVYPANSVPQSAFIGGFKFTSIVLPTSITSVGDSAFYRCGGLTGTLIIPDLVTSIGQKAFFQCQNLTGLVLSNSLTSISDNAFDGDWSLQGNLIIPGSVTSIGDFAFFYCGFTGLTIPNSVTSIGVGAFGKCKSLTGNLILPNSITTISDATFGLCARLTGVIIPNSVTSIGNDAFTMAGLTSVAIPNSVTSIGDWAFAFCHLTGGLAIPSSVTIIGNGVFYSCSGLTSIYANSTVPIDLSTSINVFGQINKSTCILYVPLGSKGLYQSANQWQDFVNIIEMSPTAINELAANEQFVLYPNPVTEGFYINAGEDLSTVSIYNSVGAKLFLSQVKSKSYIDIGNFPQGMYIVKVSTPNGIVEKKLVKK